MRRLVLALALMAGACQNLPTAPSSPVSAIGPAPPCLEAKATRGPVPTCGHGTQPARRW